MRGMFTRVAGMYDRLNRVQSLGLDVVWRRRALAALARAVPSPRRILDLATGTLSGMTSSPPSIIARFANGTSSTHRGRIASGGNAV